MPMDQEVEKGKRKPALKRKGALEVLIAVGKPKAKPEAKPAPEAEDGEAYGKGEMCTCPECGHEFMPGAESESEDED